jgi:hypothetical protein
MPDELLIRSSSQLNFRTSKNAASAAFLRLASSEGLFLCMVREIKGLIDSKEAGI